MSTKGFPFESLTFLNDRTSSAPAVSPSAAHAVLFDLPLGENEEPRPPSQEPADAWDDDHVRMPFSPSSLLSKNSLNPFQKKVCGWKLICDALRAPIRSVDDLLRAVRKYNHRSNLDFGGLKSFIEVEMSSDDRQRFFDKILPDIIRMALSLPEQIAAPIPLLKAGTRTSISLSQKQIVCLLANGFLCTFPERYRMPTGYQTFNFDSLFELFPGPRCFEKLKCILHYFEEVITNGRDGVLTFSRQSLASADVPDFKKSEKPLSKMHIDSARGIEDATGLLQLDFADPYIGGIILDDGLAQEEILFLHFPELIVSMLFTEVLGPEESFFFFGAERFTRTTGYESSFRFKEPYRDVTPRDAFRRRFCHIVGIDAIVCRSQSLQYSTKNMMRDLVKAYSGFKAFEEPSGDPVAIATGNWGCGVFGGNPHLKSLIQLIAASEAGRDLAYFTFKDNQLTDEIWEIHEFLNERDVTVGQLTTALFNYKPDEGFGVRHDIFGYIKNAFSKE